MSAATRVLILFALACAAGCAPVPVVEAPLGIGAVKVYRRARAVELPAEVCLREGILDFLAIGPESGKAYESVFVALCKPHELHAGLLAIGAKPGSIEPDCKADQRGDPLEKAEAAKLDARPRGSRVRMRVRRGRGDFEPVERWLIDRTTGKPPKRLEWTFTGSWFDADGRYMADVYQTLATVWYDGTAPLNLAHRAGSPYRGDALGYEINTEAIPPIRTPVVLRIDLVTE